MELLITGGTGFVGRPLVERLVAAGHECVVVSRDPAAAGTRLPAGARAVAYTEPWPAVAGVIHLAGESIGSGDAFYEANGNFNLLSPCNQWTGRMLARAGVVTGAWTPTTHSLTTSVAWHN